MTGWEPDRHDEEDAVRAALERGLRRQPLDGGALARMREVVRSEFDALYGWRGGRSRWPARAVAIAATVAGLTVLAALFLFQREMGPPFGNVVRAERGALQISANFFRKYELRAGQEVPSQETLTSGGTTLIALARGGLLRVAPGTSFEGAGAGEIVLRSG